MSGAIAIVGMACRYPDAGSPRELWENVLAGRQAFRRLPAERLQVEDYYSADPADPDRTYGATAAVIEGYEFDRARFRIPREAFRAVDPAHWLALEIAAEALDDAGYPDGRGLPRESTGVLIGNTLTGDVSRANSLRLRWPYVRRVLESVLVEEGIPAERARGWVQRMEAIYKAPFPAPNAETLAGGLSNTIAGRICGQFKLQGGGYTVDAACASSLLAVASACSALASGELDLALAGGVDLSLDPFELVGFAKAGALAPGEMRVYDRDSNGFCPGEGCGIVILMREEEARSARRRVHGLIRGWGVSSDGGGGITRPEADGQVLALRRAYQRAGVRIEDVPYFEGHGTGTAVGDATEVEAIARARGDGSAAPAVIGSIKANIGHTKAAAGVAGLIKATWAVRSQVLPPTTGCHHPMSSLSGERTALRAAVRAECWPADRPLQAGVSAMGFGGVNVHLVVEGRRTRRRTGLGARVRRLIRSTQDAELILVAAEDREGLALRLESLRERAGGLSRAELTDLAAHLAKELGAHPVRAAVVASSPAELAASLGTLQQWMAGGIRSRLDPDAGIFLGERKRNPRVGFLFPGQAAPIYPGGGAWACRFDAVRTLYARLGLPAGRRSEGTATAQPAIVAASMAGLRILAELGVRGELAIGHSLGELAALSWAGAIDERALIRVVTERGRLMGRAPEGSMTAIGAGRAETAALLDGAAAVIACVNSPGQTVVSGTRDALGAIEARARAGGVSATPLPVDRAFHSPLMEEAASAFAGSLAAHRWRPLDRPVISTVTGGPLPSDPDLPGLLARQLTAPVRFLEAVETALGQVDLWLEVGPGRGLTGLLRAVTEIPSIPLDAGGPSLRGLLLASGSCFVLGALNRPEALFADRFTRPLDLTSRPRFLTNPCEMAPIPGSAADVPEATGRSPDGSTPSLETVEQLVRRQVARRLDLPLAAVHPADRLLRDFHLNSISVGQLVGEVAAALELPPPMSPTEFATATVGEIARALFDLARQPGRSHDRGSERLDGVDSWVRPFTIRLDERALSVKAPAGNSGRWQVLAPPGHLLVGAVGEAMASTGRDGVVIGLPPDPDEQHLGWLLQAARAVQRPGGPRCLAMVQHGGGGGAFARTLYAETPGLTVCVVDLPLDHPRAAHWLVEEVRAARGYAEAHYDAEGCRRVPVLSRLPAEPRPEGIDLGPADVILITGGGKGITAECALAVARESGAALALLGRSDPDTDPILAENLGRFRAERVRALYLRADVADRVAVGAAVREAERRLGPITAVLHGAGSNVPRALTELDETDFRRTLAPKVRGLENVLAAVGPLRLLVTFGSIIARTGMAGEADYAVANEWQTRLTERYQHEHPDCRCTAIEWSVWSGVGMGERLGRIEALLRQGITPIPPDRGVEAFRGLLARRPPSPAVVVCGRLGDPPTLPLDRPPLPLWRFLERPRVYYPGLELVADSVLSADTDPYLQDHVLRGERLLPAVLGLEAMAQAVSALTASGTRLVFEDLRFDRPVVIPPGPPLPIRVAALVRESGAVDVVLRNGGHHADHFRATARAGQDASAGSRRLALPAEMPRVPLDPSRDLYGNLLFQSGRFQRIRRYWTLRARECLAEVVGDPEARWFGPFLASGLTLGDPGVRDAALHAVQACIPHALLLPTGVDRVAPGRLDGPGPFLVHARERSQDGDTFVYELEIASGDGRVLERWQGLRLQRVADIQPREGWPAALLGPYAERRLSEFTTGAAPAAAFEYAPGCDPRARGERAIRRLVGPGPVFAHRPDGKPVCCGAGPAISLAHAGDLSAAVSGTGAVACDLEPVVPRTRSQWECLLGLDRLGLAERIRDEAREDLDPAATRVWAALECAQKAGLAIDTPLLLRTTAAGGWVVLAAGGSVVATLAVPVRELGRPVVFAGLFGAKHNVL